MDIRVDVRGNNAISYMDIKIKKFKIFLQNLLTNERKCGIICIVEQGVVTNNAISYMDNRDNNSPMG